MKPWLFHDLLWAIFAISDLIFSRFRSSFSSSTVNSPWPSATSCLSGIPEDLLRQKLRTDLDRSPDSLIGVTLHYPVHDDYLDGILKSHVRYAVNISCWYQIVYLNVAYSYEISRVDIELETQGNREMVVSLLFNFKFLQSLLGKSIFNKLQFH